MTDSRDIVLRLREPESHYDDVPRHEDCVLMEEAADEIERLRAAIDKASDAVAAAIAANNLICQASSD